jgi:hypothetical protein
MKKLLKKIFLDMVIIIGVSVITNYVYSTIKGIDFPSSLFSFGPLSSIVMMCVAFTIGDVIKYCRGKL